MYTLWCSFNFLLKKLGSSWACWHKPFIPAYWKKRQADISEFQIDSVLLTYRKPEVWSWHHINWTWWYIFVIPVQERWRQEYQEFKVIPGYIMNLALALSTCEPGEREGKRSGGEKMDGEYSSSWPMLLTVTQLLGIALIYSTKV